MNKKKFIYGGKTIYYLVKDITWKEVRGKEMAKAFMIIFDENNVQKDVFAVYDERYIVMYGMPDDAKRWYKEYING